MSTEPERWLDRVVGACFGLLLGALALYAAVHLLMSVWPVLALGAIIATVIGGLTWVRHQTRW